MKIAIMTWFSFYNYGTILQAYALQEIIKELGNEACIIQYYPKYKKTKYYINLPTKILIKKAVKKIMSLGNDYIVGNHSGNAYRHFIAQNINLTDLCRNSQDLKKLNDDYEAFVCGSDQIWSPISFDKHYYLDFVDDYNKKIAYAPSFGIEKLDNIFICPQLISLVRNIKYLSIREKGGSDILAELTGLNSSIVLDPVCLIKKTSWIEKLNIRVCNSDRYILCYFLGRNYEYYNLIKEYAKNHGCCLRIIPVYKTDLNRDGVIMSEVSPIDFLEYIYNAEAVFSDSFHAIVFSIIFEKKFVYFNRFELNDPINQNNRIYNFLAKMNLSNRVFSSSIDNVMNIPIDYLDVNKHMDYEIDHSKAFLSNALSEISSIL